MTNFELKSNNKHKQLIKPTAKSAAAYRNRYTNEKVMDAIIYLDQNTLSDLRTRKIEGTKDKEFTLLKRVLLSANIQVVYSYVTLCEIDQITVDKYKSEHIQLLEELDAKFIEPLSRTVVDRKPRNVWSDYKNNQKENKLSGISEVVQLNEHLSRKLSGLPIQESFEDINYNLKTSLAGLLGNCAENLNDIDIDMLEEPLRSNLIGMKEKLPQLLSECDNLAALPIPEDQRLGPKPFREISELKKLKIMELPPPEVIPSIEELFILANPKFNWDDYFNDTPDCGVSKAYCLMNWAGYYADDFDKATKKGDRFRASNNDMQHAIMGMGVTFVLSNDNAFRMKAKACYAYVGINTIVCSSLDFLQKHCKFV